MYSIAMVWYKVISDYSDVYIENVLEGNHLDVLVETPSY